MITRNWYSAPSCCSDSFDGISLVIIENFSSWHDEGTCGVENSSIVLLSSIGDEKDSLVDLS